MKKQLLIYTFLLIGFLTNAQTIVSTAPQNKKVILEEFTGIYCVYCPQGHAIAQAMKNADPNNVFLINVHVGGYAAPTGGDPDFRTPFGTAIAGQSNLAGYPAGTVNRREFAGLQQNGTGTAMSRGNWTNAGNQIKLQSSYVNVAVESSINVTNNELTVHVEAYYTGASPVSTNLLNVALLQNNTTGPQTGGNAGNEYVHQHRLVHMITGQWGESITTTTSGTFVDRTYTYTLPANYNGIPVEISELEIVAFVAETQQNIISGNGSTPTFTGIVGNDVNLKSIDPIASQCINNIGPKVQIQNISQTPLTSLSISYDINSGTPQVYNWTGNLTSMQSTEIQLPAINYSILPTNTVNVTLPSDYNTTNNVIGTSFNKSVETTNNLTLALQTDGWGSECTWNIKNSAGTTVQSGGPYANNATLNIPITLSADDCYTFNLLDSYGDGGAPISLTDSNSVVIYSTSGAYGSGDFRSFATGAFLNVDSHELGGFTMYPNPTDGILNIISPTKIEISISDISGKIIYKNNNIINETTIDLTFLQSGVYFAKIKSDSAEKNQKIIIK
jgi:hypothetical protein